MYWRPLTENVAAPPEALGEAVGRRHRGDTRRDQVDPALGYRELDPVQDRGRGQDHRVRRAEQQPVARGAVDGDEVVAFQLRPLHVAHPGDRVVAPAGDDEALLDQRLELQLALLRADEVEAEVRLAARHRQAGVAHHDTSAVGLGETPRHLAQHLQLSVGEDPKPV